MTNRGRPTDTGPEGRHSAARCVGPTDLGSIGSTSRNPGLTAGAINCRPSGPQTSNEPHTMSRRDLLGQMATGLGGVALAGLLAKTSGAADQQGRHFPPKAKRVIFL